MKVIEENAENSEYTRRVEAASGIRALLHRPCERGTEQYAIWITQLRRPVAMLNDADSRRFLETSRCVLEFYNTSLLMNDDCDTQDAMEYLTAQFRRLSESTGNSVADVDLFLQELFESKLRDAVCQKQANTNPKLILLEGKIRKVFSEKPESRAIVFVKTRDMAVCLERWMKRRPNLKVLKPGKIVGAGASSERGGMTKNQQVDAMQYFRDGDHKIMVATSVAEEGLDIRQCNLVIRYNYVTNEIAMVQARGRARAENSQFVTVASCNQGVAEKDEINIIREMMMHEAIRQLQEEMTTRLADYHQTIIKIQAEEKEKRDIELAMMNGRTLKEGEVVLRCRKCDAFACMSSDIRTVEKAHHVIIDPEFSDRRTEKYQPKHIKISGDMCQQGKLHCKECGLDWGIVAQHSGTTFPVIKIDSFTVVDEVGRRDAPKKWRNTNFPVEELSLEELLQYRRRALASGRDAE
ncbi:hypothetical protein C0Q70_08965 [Pomacea canaliculata]|uniref:RNA helicase n=1 Tax=Pomacea canaliculata TaxID=400727 RepID=A0A2T7P8G9_POMCA|nr:hypothetical protein C0Q70_08965 [Pomacea canaliculata]